MNNYNWYSIPREMGKIDSGAYNTQEGTILEAKKCCGLFHVSDSGGGIVHSTTHIRMTLMPRPFSRFCASCLHASNLPLICISYRNKKCWAAMLRSIHRRVE